MMIDNNDLPDNSVVWTMGDIISGVDNNYCGCTITDDDDNSG